MSKKKQKYTGVVYSTNSDYDYQSDEENTEETPEAKYQDLRISLDKKQRGGKKVTLITGFVGNEDDLKDLGKTLKSKCGVGGSAKNGEILVQGDFKQKVKDILENLGYRCKLAGG